LFSLTSQKRGNCVFVQVSGLIYCSDFRVHCVGQL